MSQHPFWDEKRPSHHLTLQCLLQQTLLWENTHCCVWGQWRSCDLLCGPSVSSNDSACAHPLFIAFLPAQNTVDSQLATVKHENVSETGFPCLLSCFQRFYGGTLSCLSLHRSGHHLLLSGSLGPIFRQQESNWAHTSPGWCGRVHREPAVSMCTSGSGKMNSAYTNYIILA